MSEKGQATIAGVREAADEEPWYVYNGQCVYVEGGRPGCIVGQGLWRKGYIDETFARSNRNALNASVFIDPPFDFDRDEIDWLLEVQHQQDNGVSWGRAVKMADAKFALVS